LIHPSSFLQLSWSATLAWSKAFFSPNPYSFSNFFFLSADDYPGERASLPFQAAGAGLNS